MILAFTGTRNGITDHQSVAAGNVLLALAKQYLNDNNRFLCGCCEGADRELLFNGLYVAPNWSVELYPSSELQNRWALRLLSDFAMKDANGYILYPIMKPLVRNKIMAKRCDQLLATPAASDEALRSGTWATIRYALKARKFITIINPDGTVREEDHR